MAVSLTWQAGTHGEVAAANSSCNVNDSHECVSTFAFNESADAIARPAGLGLGRIIALLAKEDEIIHRPGHPRDRGALRGKLST